ncbi:MAG: hypothetical protein ACRDSR_22665 [Pseudonocardiaceae bacterium]
MPAELTAAELDCAGLLHAKRNIQISRFAIFVYALGQIYCGAGDATMISSGAVLRCGAIVYAGVCLGENTLVGHHLTIERATRIGHHVRCSPGSHITSSTQIADRVFLGAGIRTINDKTLIWRDPNRTPTLAPPRFDTGVKVGSGSTVLAGVTIGAHALIGAASLVTHDIPAGALAYGHPARVHGQAQ